MRAVKKARRLILSDPEHATANVLAQLILSLETNSDFALHQLYQLRLSDFELAVEILKEWRLDRYYEGKSKLIDTAIQFSELARSVPQK